MIDKGRSLFEWATQQGTRAVGLFGDHVQHQPTVSRAASGGCYFAGSCRFSHVCSMVTDSADKGSHDTGPLLESTVRVGKRETSTRGHRETLNLHHNRNRPCWVRELSVTDTAQGNADEIRETNPSYSLLGCTQRTFGQDRAPKMGRHTCSTSTGPHSLDSCKSISRLAPILVILNTVESALRAK